MNVRVQYMAQLRASTGRVEEDVHLEEGASLAELLCHLAETHGTARSHFVTETGQARPSLLIVVNEAAVPAREAAVVERSPEEMLGLGSHRRPRPPRGTG